MRAEQLAQLFTNRVFAHAPKITKEKRAVAAVMAPVAEAEKGKDSGAPKYKNM